MKIVASREALLNEVKVAVELTPKRTTVDIYKNVCICAEGEKVSVTGSDGELTAECHLESVEVLSPGRALVDAKLLTLILSRLSGDVVTIESESGLMTISDSHAEFSLSSANEAEYPTPRSQPNGSLFSVPCPELMAAIRRCLIAVSKDSTSYPAMCGIRIEVSSDKVEVIATDSRRMSVSNIKLGSPVDSDANAVIPDKAANGLLSMLSGCEGVAEINITEKEVSFSTGFRILRTRQVSGRFPSWRKVVDSRKSTVEIPVDNDGWRSVFRQSTICLSKDRPGVSVKIDQGELTVNTVSDGKKSSVCAACCHDGSPVDFTVNPQYMIDFLGVIGESDCFFRPAGDDGPMEFSSDGFRHLIMTID